MGKITAKELFQSNPPNIRSFKPDEWPDGVLRDMDAGVIEAAQLVRTNPRYNRPMHPSPNPRAHVRMRENDNPSSQHYAIGRLSTASDFYIEGHPLGFLLAAAETPGVKGVGIYLDVSPYRGCYVMTHIDIRQGDPLYWVRVGGEYTYLHKEPEHFWELLGNYGDFLGA